MLKYALLAGAMALSAPALAQDVKPGRTPTPPIPEATTAVPAPAPQDQMATPATPAPVDQAAQLPSQPATTPAPLDQSAQTPDAPVTPAAPADQAAQAPAQPAAPSAATETQVASVVKAEFPTYDKDSSGGLNDAEFGAWMGALRKASEPSIDTASAEVKTWIEGAFAQADADKSKSVTQGELTTFLTAGQPS